MSVTVEERLATIEQMVKQIADCMPAMERDIEDLKEFKWKLVGQMGLAIGICVPIYTAVVVYLLSHTS